MASEKIDFEASLAELSLIVEKLESGECTLEESVTLYEQGIKLSERCSKALSVAKQKILTLTDAESEEI